MKDASDLLYLKSTEIFLTEVTRSCGLEAFKLLDFKSNNEVDEGYYISIIIQICKTFLIPDSICNIKKVHSILSKSL